MFMNIIYVIEMNRINITPPAARKGMALWMDCELMLQSESC